MFWLVLWCCFSGVGSRRMTMRPAGRSSPSRPVRAGAACGAEACLLDACCDVMIITRFYSKRFGHVTEPTVLMRINHTQGLFVFHKSAGLRLSAAHRRRARIQAASWRYMPLDVGKIGSDLVFRHQEKLLLHSVFALRREMPVDRPFEFERIRAPDTRYKLKWLGRAGA